jgi:hypothetical protein
MYIEWTVGSIPIYPDWINLIGNIKHEVRSPKTVAARKYIIHGFVRNERRVKTNILNEWPIIDRGIIKKQ